MREELSQTKSLSARCCSTSKTLWEVNAAEGFRLELVPLKAFYADALDGDGLEAKAERWGVRLQAIVVVLWVHK